MPSTRPAHLMTTPVPLALGALLVGVLSACGGGSTGSTAGSGSTVEVAAGDDTCTLSSTDLDAGGTTFAVTNEGSKVTEVYLYAEKAGAFTRVVAEVENIGPGTSRDLDVDLEPGSYEVACKPGQKGDGIRTPITVAGNGAGAAPASSPAEGGYDREIELTVDADGLTGLEPATAEQGERLELKLANGTDATRTFEVIDPAGTVVSEFDVPAGEEGEDIVEMSTTGAWTLKVEGGPADIEATLSVGATG